VGLATPVAVSILAEKVVSILVLVLGGCPGNLSWELVLGACPGSLPWELVLGAGHGREGERER